MSVYHFSVLLSLSVSFYRSQSLLSFSLSSFHPIFLSLFVSFYYLSSIYNHSQLYLHIQSVSFFFYFCFLSLLIFYLSVSLSISSVLSVTLSFSLYHFASFLYLLWPSLPSSFFSFCTSLSLIISYHSLPHSLLPSNIFSFCPSHFFPLSLSLSPTILTFFLIPLSLLSSLYFLLFYFLLVWLSLVEPGLF